MGLNLVPAGRNLPDDFNVVIEIPMNADPVPFAPVPGWPRGVSGALCCGRLGSQWRDNPDLASSAAGT